MHVVARSVAVLILLLILSACAVVGPGAPRASASAATTAESDTLAMDLLSLLNAERAALSLAPLGLSPEAGRVAQERAVDMAANNYFAHVSPSGVGPVELLRRHGVTYSLVGENIGRSSQPAGQVITAIHNALMASPGHRDNVLHPAYERVGIGIASSGGMYYVAQVFLS